MGEPIEGRRIEGDSRSLDRILALSDGVFAIALALLVLNIEVPEIPDSLVAEELPGELPDLWPKYLSYLLSFVVILFYWMAHYSIFGLIRDHDRALVWLNSLFLLCVAFLPFPTALLGEYGVQQLVVVIYTGSLDITRLLLSSVWWYVSGKPHLASIDMDPSTMRAFHIRAWAIPLIFLVSIAVSFFSVTAAVCSWLFVGNRGFRALTRAAPIQIARLLKQRTPLAQAFTQHRADRKSNQNSLLPALLQGEERANGCSTTERLDRVS